MPQLTLRFAPLLLLVGSVLSTACSSNPGAGDDGDDDVLIPGDPVSPVISQYGRTIEARDLESYRALHAPGAVVALNTDSCLPWLDTRWWLSQLGACWDGDVQIALTILNQDPVFDSNQNVVAVNVTTDLVVAGPSDTDLDPLRVRFRVGDVGGQFGILAVSLVTE